MSRHICDRISVRAPLAALFVFGATACGNIWTTPESSQQQAAVENSSDSGISTVGATAAVGAALGGTAGLIIGSSTGNAGEGVILGSLTGAAVGGLIGNELEGIEEIDAEQDDVLRRHEEILKKQQREIEDLKRMGGSDQMAAAEFPGNTSSLRAPAPVLAGKSNISSTDLLGASSSTAGKGSAGLPPAMRGRLKDEAPKAVGEDTERVYLQLPSHPLPGNSAGEQTASISQPAPKVVRQPAPKLITPPKASKPAERAATPAPEKEREIASVPAKKPARAVAATSLAIPAKKEPMQTAALAPTKNEPTSNKCMLAESEAERARNAASDADKLFYYRRAIQLCPSAAVYHIEIGRVYIDIGRQEDAEFEFRRALDLDPDNRQAQDQLTLLQAGE